MGLKKRDKEKRDIKTTLKMPENGSGTTCCGILLGAMLGGISIAQLVLGGLNLHNCSAQKMIPYWLLWTGALGLLGRFTQDDDGKSKMDLPIFASFIAGAYFVFSCTDCVAPQNNATTTATGWLLSGGHEADDAFGPLFSNPVSNSSGLHCDHATYMFSKVTVIFGLVGYGLSTLLICCVCCGSRASSGRSQYEFINN